MTATQRKLTLTSDGKTVNLHVDVDADLWLTLSEEKKAKLIDFVARLVRGEPASLSL